MTPNKDTRKYFSIASSPGNFGASIYNYVFERTNTNAIYLPLRISTTAQFKDVVNGLQYAGASGLNISMPFKRKAYEWVSEYGKIEGNNNLTTQNINTLVKHDEHCWIPYNTDCDGFYLACLTFLPEIKTANIVGNGAVASTIRSVLETNGITCINLKVGETHPLADLLVNATPIGMDHVPDNYFTDTILTSYTHVFDVVVKPRTNLIQMCRRLEKKYIPGYMMSMYQLIRQYNLHFPESNPQKIYELVHDKMKAMDYEL